MRRFRRFTEMANGHPEGNAWDYVPKGNILSHTGAPAVSGGTSKRAEKRVCLFFFLLHFGHSYRYNESRTPR
jgi:hypothetical protein